MWLLGLGLAAQARDATDAADTAAQAEAQLAEQIRLRAELDRLAARNAWAGVSRVFAELEAAGPPVPLDVVLLGAQAALAEGDVLLAVQRLQDATTGEPRDGDAWGRAREQLADLEHRYGAVRITVYTPKVPELDRPEMPLAPDERTVIEEVRRRVLKERRFLGMLPVGRYVLGEVPFEVQSRAPIADVRVGVPPQSGSSGD